MVLINVELINFTPDPVETCGRAAGICYDKELKEDYGTFVKRIVASGHESVLEHASFTFRLEGVSRALTHQLVRHRMASYSQRSQRYVDEGEFGYVVPNSIRERKEALETYEEHMKASESTYKRLRAMGIKKQDARYVLPNAAHSRIIVTMNARSLRNFFVLRLAKDAQWEIRALAVKMYDLVLPEARAIFEDMRPLRDAAAKSIEEEGLME